MKPLYLLDTCIISEPVKVNPNTALIAKLKKHEGLTALPSVVRHEMLYGTQRLSEGKRRDRLFNYLVQVIIPLFPVMPYDEHAAWVHADLRAELEKKGKTLPFVDGIIASIAIANNMILITRNTNDFVNIQHLMLENWFSD